MWLKKFHNRVKLAVVSMWICLYLSWGKNNPWPKPKTKVTTDLATQWRSPRRRLVKRSVLLQFPFDPPPPNQKAGRAQKDDKIIVLQHLHFLGVIPQGVKFFEDKEQSAREQTNKQTHTNKHTNTQTHAHTRTHARTRTRTRTHTHTHTHTHTPRTRTCAHTHIHTHTHTHPHAHAQTTYTQTNTNTHTHTHTHTHAPARACMHTSRTRHAHVAHRSCARHACVAHVTHVSHKHTHTHARTLVTLCCWRLSKQTFVLMEYAMFIPKGTSCAMLKFPSIGPGEVAGSCSCNSVFHGKSLASMKSRLHDHVWPSHVDHQGIKT